MLDGLAAYERRHGWKGHLLNAIARASGAGRVQASGLDFAGRSRGITFTRLVTGVLPYQVTARIGDKRLVLTDADWAWTGQKSPESFLAPGDIIYVHLNGDVAPAADRARESTDLHGTLEQDSGAQGALLAVDNTSGDVLAMVGGRDFNLSQFNRATQAERQTGSSFKPYVYTAAVEEGVTPEERIVDAPFSVGSYTPHDYEGNYLGKISLLKAFADSRNIPALKLAERVGMKKVIEVAHRFGITSRYSGLLAGGAGRGRGDAEGAGGGVCGFSERWFADRSAAGAEGYGCRWFGDCGRQVRSD